jgi:DNA ligase (NAD+)
MENTLTLSQRIEKYKEYKEAYYKGDPIISDEEFDQFEEDLVSDGFDPFVGEQKLDAHRKRAHRFRMLSLGKYQVLTDEITREMAEDIFNKYGKGFMSWKYDGMAVEAQYSQGVLDCIVTRGDGMEGEDITQKLWHLFPNQLEYNMNVDVRCEVIMDQNLFIEKYSDQYSHSRNLVVGIAKDLNLNDPRKYDLDIAVLEAIDPKDGVLIDHKQLHATFIEKSKVGNDVNHVEDLIDMFNGFARCRFRFPIGTDGVVYTSIDAVKVEHNNKYPKHATAIKFKPPRLESTVTKIEWNLKKSGNYIPKIFFEPIEVDGRMIKQANGHNIEYLIENDIKPGASVDIVLSNDIIPMVKKKKIVE